MHTNLLSGEERAASQSSARTNPVAPAHRTWLWVAVLLLLACQLGFCWTSRTRSLSARVDLRAFYAAGTMVASHQGSELYDLEHQREIQGALFHGSGQTLPFLYPAFMALPFVPLAQLPYRAAFGTFLLLNLLCLSGSVLLLRSEIPALRRVPAPLLIGAAASLLPVAMAMMQGQVSFLLLLLYTLAYVLLRRQREFLAGLLIALALGKFQIAVPVVLLFLLWRRWRVCGGFALGAVALGCLSVAIGGRAGTFSYLHELTGVTSTTMLDPVNARARYGMFAGDMPNLHGFWFTATHGAPLGLVLCVACSGMGMLWGWRQRASLPLALSIGMLVSYHMQAYDLTLLILPLAVAAGCLWDRATATHSALDDRRATTPGRVLVFAVSVAALVTPVSPLLLMGGLSSLMIVAVCGSAWLSAGAPGWKRIQRGWRSNPREAPAALDLLDVC